MIAARPLGDFVALVVVDRCWGAEGVTNLSVGGFKLLSPDRTGLGMISLPMSPSTGAFLVCANDRWSADDSTGGLSAMNNDRKS